MFEELKRYLSSPSLLTKSQPNEELLQYLALFSGDQRSSHSERRMNSKADILYQQVLHNAETRYSKLEKLIFVLVVTARKLRPYFQAHTVVLLIDQLIKAFLHRPDTSGWIAKWVLELVEPDVQYHPKFAIKAQVLADFILECTIPNRQSSQDEESSGAGRCSEVGESSKGEETDIGSDPEKFWMLYVDGSLNAFGARARLILIDLEGVLRDTHYALNF